MIKTIGWRVPSHSPVWWQDWQSNESLIVSDDLLSCSFEEEINIKVSSCGDIAENRASVFPVRDDWGLCVGISEENTNELTFSSNKAEWVNSIWLFTTIFCARLFSTDTMRPHCEGTFSELEVVHSFTESVDLFRWESHVNLHELVLNDKCLVFSVNHRFTSLWTCEREWEWLSLPLETLCFKSVLSIFLLLGNNMLWNFKSGPISIVVIAQREERSCVVRLTKLKADLFDVLVI